MKISVWFVLVGGILGCASVLAADTPSSARQQIQAELNAMLSAANAHDTDAFMAPSAHKSSLLFIFNGKVIRGWDALHAQQLQWWQNGKATGTFEAHGADEFMSLDAKSVVTTSSYTSHRIGADGKASTGHFVVTYIWKHLPVGWRIIYGHESWAR